MYRKLKIGMLEDLVDLAIILGCAVSQLDELCLLTRSKLLKLVALRYLYLELFSTTL